LSWVDTAAQHVSGEGQQATSQFGPSGWVTFFLRALAEKAVMYPTANRLTGNAAAEMPSVFNRSNHHMASRHSHSLKKGRRTNQ
jgi:hypothetical protein